MRNSLPPIQERLIYDETPIKKHSCPKTDQSIAPPLSSSTEKPADRERDPLPPFLLARELAG